MATCSIYQLRAGLDSLVYEVAIIDSGEDPPPQAEDLEFPIRSTEKKFKNVAWKIAPLTKQHRDMVESIQPYHAKYDNEAMRQMAEALDRLNDWARKDRHRGMRVVGSWGANKNPLFDLPPGCKVEWVVPTPDGILEHESKVASFKLSGWQRGMELTANPNFTIEPTIEDAPPPTSDEESLSGISKMMIACVGLVIEGFEETLV